MNTTFDLQDLQQLLHNLMRPEALIEVAVLLACLGLSWLACAGFRRTLRVDGAVLFGRRLIDGVLFPVLALLFALLARELLANLLTPAVFRVAIPILTALMLLRLFVRVLAAAFPQNAWMRAIERAVMWVATTGAVLWVLGVLPALMATLDDVHWKVGGTEISLSHLIEGSLTAALVMLLALWASAALERKIVAGTATDLSTRKIISNLVRTVLLFVGLMVALSAVGIDLTALSVFGGAIGVGLGFGLQKIAANYVSGFVILAERSLRIGDMVKIDNFEGRITDIRTRYTSIRALGGRDAIVPNEMLITQRVENSSLADPRVSVSTAVQVAYGTDVRALRPKLVAAMLGVPRVLPKPAPSVLLSSFAADGMDLALGFWIGDPENGQGGVKSDVNLAVLDVLNAEGIEIPFPQRVMHTLAPAKPGE